MQQFACDFPMCGSYFDDKCTRPCCDGMKDFCTKHLNVDHHFDISLDNSQTSSNCIGPIDSVSNLGKEEIYLRSKLSFNSVTLEETLLETYTPSTSCISKHLFEDNAGKKRCKLCKKSYTNNKKTTSNLLNHIKSSHTTLFSNITLKRENSNVSLQSNKRSKNEASVMEAWNRAMFKQDKFMDILSTFIASCDESFTIVEKPSFQHLAEYLHPGLSLPSH